jgi:hypothetical protein
VRSFEKRFLSYRERRAIPGHFGSSPRTCFQKIVARTAPKSRLYSRYSHSTSDCATPRHGRNLPRTGELSSGAERMQWNRRNKDEPKTLAAGIVLLHDLHKNTAEAVPELLRQPSGRIQNRAHCSEGRTNDACQIRQYRKASEVTMMLVLVSLSFCCR